MPVYKGKYIQQSDDTYTVELYKDDIVSETITSVRNANEAKGIILVWHAQQGYTRPDITDQNFTEDWDKANFIANWKYEVRMKRNALIAETDWIHLPDVTISDSYKAALLTYRQKLRDIPATVDDYLSKFEYPTELSRQHWDGLDWPTKPSP